MVDKDGNPVASFKEATTDFVPTLGILCDDCRASCDKCYESICRLCVKMCVECAKERDSTTVVAKPDEKTNLEIAKECNKNALENPEKNIYKNYSVFAMLEDISLQTDHLLCGECSNHCIKCQNFYCDKHFNPEELAICNNKCLDCKKYNLLYQQAVIIFDFILYFVIKLIIKHYNRFKRNVTEN